MIDNVMIHLTKTIDNVMIYLTKTIDNVIIDNMTDNAMIDKVPCRRCRLMGEGCRV